MLFLLRGTFNDEAEARRDAEHEKFGLHLAQRFPRIRLGGSLRDEAGRRTGVLLIVEADRRDEIDAFLADSPYGRAGLYRVIEVDLLDLEIGSLS